MTQLFEGKQIELLGERTTVRPSQSDKFLQKIPSDLGSGDMILAYDQEAVFQVRYSSSRHLTKMPGTNLFSTRSNHPGDP